MERSRRDRFTNVAPSAGEFTVAALLAGVFLVVATPLAVQGIVSWVTAGLFALPSGHLLEAYGSLLRGEFGAGLPPEAADALPTDATMGGLTLLGEVVVVGAAVVLAHWLRDMTGTGSRHGLATSAQAAEALGMPRLRASAAVVRPDLYGRPSRRSQRWSGLKAGRRPTNTDHARTERKVYPS